MNMGFGIVACAAALGALSGCSTTYTAQVSNASATAVHAQLVHERDGEIISVVDEATLAPGDTNVLGPASVEWTDRLALMLMSTATPPRRLDRTTISRGMNIYEVHQRTSSGPELRLIDHSSPLRVGIESPGSDSPLD